MSSPYVILKSAMSVDGFIDDTSRQRLLLSSKEDFDRLDEARSLCDAILVGAGTIRADDPSLLVKSDRLQRQREKQGLPSQPIKVTVTRSGQIPKRCKFVTAGDNEKVIYCNQESFPSLVLDFNNIETVKVMAMDNMELPAILRDLYRRGIRKLLVEGGNKIGTSFLTSNCVDELQVSIAPFFVGEAGAPRFVNPACFSNRLDNPMQLIEVERLGQVVLITYKLGRQ